jgi:hypothetical protein
MASGAADGIGDGASVDADAGAVQSGSEDTDGVVGARGKVVEVIGALPARTTAHATEATERKKTAKTPSISLPFDKATKRISKSDIASGNTTRSMLHRHKKTMSP